MRRAELGAHILRRGGELAERMRLKPFFAIESNTSENTEKRGNEFRCNDSN